MELMRDQLGGLQETLQNFTQTSRSDPGQFQRLKNASSECRKQMKLLEIEIGYSSSLRTKVALNY